MNGRPCPCGRPWVCTGRVPCVCTPCSLLPGAEWLLTQRGLQAPREAVRAHPLQALLWANPRPPSLAPLSRWANWSGVLCPGALVEPGFSPPCCRETLLPAPFPRDAGTPPPAEHPPHPTAMAGQLCPAPAEVTLRTPPRGLAGLRGSLLAQLEEAPGRGHGCPHPATPAPPSSTGSADPCWPLIPSPWQPQPCFPGPWQRANRAGMPRPDGGARRPKRRGCQQGLPLPGSPHLSQ